MKSSIARKTKSNISGMSQDSRMQYKLTEMHATRRLAMMLIAFLLVGSLAVLAAECSAAQTKESAKLKLEREKMKNHHRRIMYNDDGCGPSFSAEGATPQGFLYGPTARMGGIVGTQVDSVFICSGATPVLNHPSSVGETYPDVVDLHSITEWKTIRDTHRALFDAGTDPIKLTQDFCKKLGVEVFYSYRVNDIHNCRSQKTRTEHFCAFAVGGGLVLGVRVV